MPARVRQSTKSAKNAGAQPVTTPATSSWSSRITRATPRPESRLCTSATSSAVAQLPAVMATAPERSCMGRLGMQRTTCTPSASQPSSVATLTPAAIETTRRPASASAMEATTPGSTCGLTARKTTSGSASASIWDASATAVAPSASNDERTSALRSLTKRCAASSSPESTRPRAMAPPMAPAPTKAMFPSKDAMVYP